ncbi:SHD1 domain-containing protein [Pontiella sulfatireligans]|nr:SHD1 domain-containing protein [Pontiella sulfatireligans]
MKWILGLVLLLGAVAPAEFRVWEGSNGSVVEAELVSVKGGRAELRKRDGKSVKVPVSKLSAKDQKYIKLSVPPQFKFALEIQEDSEGSFEAFEARGGSGTKSVILERTDAKCHAAIKKTSTDAFGGKIGFWMLLFGNDPRSDTLVFFNEKHLEIDGFKAGHQELALETPPARIADGQVPEGVVPVEGESILECAGGLLVAYNAQGRIIDCKETKTGLRERVEARFGSLEEKVPLNASALKVERWGVLNQEGTIARGEFGEVKYYAFAPQIFGHYPCSPLLMGDFSVTCKVEVLAGERICPRLIPPNHEEDHRDYYIYVGQGGVHEVEVSRNGDDVRFLVDGEHVMHEEFQGLRLDTDKACLFSMGGMNTACKVWDIKMGKVHAD